MIYLIKIFSLIVVVLACIYATYTDIRYRKITNQLNYSLISLAIIINLVLFGTGDASIMSFIRNFIMAIIASFVMYYTGLWSPGDSKLFIAASILIPLDYFKYYLIPSFPSLSILTNAFIPGFLALVIFLLIKTTSKQKLESLKRTFDYKFVLRFLLTFFIFFSAGSFILNLFFQITNIIQNFFFAVIIYILFFYILDNYINIKYNKYIYTILFIVSIINLLTVESYTEYTYFFLVTFFSFLIFRFFFLDLSKSVFIREINLHELKQGDVPAEMVFETDNGYFKREISYFSLISQVRRPEKSKEVLGHKPEGLNKKEIQLIKKSALGGCFNTLKIQKSIHFALFILIGTLITLVLRGDFILFLLYS